MHYFQLILMGAFFGSSAMIFRIISAELSVFTTVFFRFLVGGTLLSIFCLISKVPIIQWKNIGKVLFISVCNFVVPLTLFCAAGRILDSSLVSILNGMFPVFTIILAHFVLKDKMSITGVVGVFLAMLGVCVINMKALVNFEASQILAALMILLATMCYAVSTIFTRTKCKDIPPITNATGAIVLGALFLSPAVFFEVNLTALTNPKILLAVLYLGVFSTALSYGIFFHLIKVRGATFASYGTFLVPIFGSIYGVIFMNEVMTANRIIGGLLILLGLALILKLYPNFAKK